MRQRRKTAGRGDRLNSAQEIACFAYCPEQWRLQYGLELLPANQAALTAGDRHHTWNALAERFAGMVIGVGRVVVIIAVVVLALLWLAWR
jgi:hypothetical protein